MRKSILVLIAAMGVFLSLTALIDRGKAGPLLHGGQQVASLATSPAKTDAALRYLHALISAGAHGKKVTDGTSRIRIAATECPVGSGEYCSDQFPVCCLVNNTYGCYAHLSDCKE